ncbi:MAG: acetolactate synthase large subunit [Gemmatimonadota bacterium]
MRGEPGLTGADVLVRTLVAAGVEVCFTNPGTSEMHVVAALDRELRLRAVLGLFEGVVTGAADGYARIAGKPACTLLHLGPGLANGIANLHNARRARVPLVNVVGDHAVGHRLLDPPLNSDIEGLAGAVSGWVHLSKSSSTVGADAARAVAASYGPPGQIATLILPADAAWNRAEGVGEAMAPLRPSIPESRAVDMIAELLRGAGDGATLLMNGDALSERGLELAGRVHAATGARLFADTFVTKMARGGGRVAVPKLPYYGEDVLRHLAGTRHLILVGTKAPVSFFAYPGEPGALTPEGCSVHVLARPDQHLVGALSALAEALGASRADPGAAAREAVPLPTGALTPDSLGQALAALLPENAIVMNEGATAARRIPGWTTNAAPHDWMDLTGGAIGMGLPAAAGAAIAAPDRRVVSLQADGSGMYTVQALWTQAREGLDVTTIVLANRKYAILEGEYRRTGAGEPSPKGRALFELTRPELDWVSLARGMGVPGTRVGTADALAEAIRKSFSEQGPFVIEALL